jgi:hypothetical protein
VNDGFARFVRENLKMVGKPFQRSAIIVGEKRDLRQLVGGQTV